MRDNKSSQHKPCHPDVLTRLLDTPQLLPHEDVKDFLRLFDSVEDYTKPLTSWDYLVTYQASMLTWEILRYHKMKVGMLLSHQRPALESLLRKFQVRTASRKGIGEAVAQSEARQLAAPWFKDPASRPAMMKTIENAGYPPNAIELEAFQLALPTLATIERLIVSAQKRLDQYLKGLEKTSKARAEALRAATAKAIDANASGQSQASEK